MSAFVTEFLGARDAWTWPTVGESNDAIVADFVTLTSGLLSTALTLTPPAPDGSGSMRDRLANFLIAQKWPVNTLIPARWAGIQPTVRLIEISVITDHILEALNAFRLPDSRGGGPGAWPPH